jgi:hypothetical protein
MTLASNISTVDWITLGPRLVGATFVWAASIKAIAPHTFRRHLESLGWLPFKQLPLTVTAAAGLEAGWGLALIAGIAPAVVYPATLLLLVVLTSASWWGVRSGKAQDCGCYGGYIQPSIAQSMGLNATFALLVIAAWATSKPTSAVKLWQVVVIVAASILIGGIAEAAQRHARKTGKLLFDTSPLKLGRRWRHSWADGKTARIDGEMLVAFLGPNCPYCSQFVKVANAMAQSPQLPKVFGVIAARDEEVSAYVLQQGIRFPVATVSQSLMSRLTSAVPTVVIVESGRIQNMWMGNVPPGVVDRFREAFFPNIAEQAAHAGR